MDLSNRVRRFSHEAMATVFEICVAETGAEYAQQAAWAAFEELDRLESELSRYVNESDIARVNARSTPGNPLVSARTLLPVCSGVLSSTRKRAAPLTSRLACCWTTGAMHGPMGGRLARRSLPGCANGQASACSNWTRCAIPSRWFADRSESTWEVLAKAMRSTRWRRSSGTGRSTPP